MSGTRTLLLSLTAGVATFVCMAIFFFGYQGQEEGLVMPMPTPAQQPPASQPIETSLVLLFGQQVEEPYAVQRVRDEIRYVGRVDRPGEAGDQGWVCLREGEVPRKVKAGDVLPLELDPTASQLRLKWSSGQSPLTLRVMNFTGDSLAADVELCEVGCYPVAMKLYEAPRQRSWDVGGHVVDGRLLLKMEGRWFGADLLCSDTQPDEGPFQHFEFGFGPRCYVVTIPARGTLSYVEGRWAVGCQAGHPIARIESVEAQRVNLKVWDATGLLRADVQMPRLVSNSDLNGLAGQLHLKALRGPHRALIQLGQQSLLCREGDWLVKRADAWQVLGNPTSRAAWWQAGGVGEVIVVEQVQRARGKPRVQLKLYSAVHADAQSVVLQPTGNSGGSHATGGAS